MVKHRVFFSFEYNKDNWRASQIKEMGLVDNSSTFSSNEWEKVKRDTDYAIKRWIDNQLRQRACLVVLVGTTTSTRKWVKYEIERAVTLQKGIVGVYIHGLKDSQGNQAEKGRNPFEDIYTSQGECLANHVKCYDSYFSTSSYVYQDLKKELPFLIENAIENRFTY